MAETTLTLSAPEHSERGGAGGVTTRRKSPRRGASGQSGEKRHARLMRSNATLTRGYMTRSELQSLAIDRLDLGAAVDWEQWCFCAAALIDAIRPGKLPTIIGRNGHVLQREYYKTWPQCTPEAFLCFGENRLANSLNDLPPELPPNIVNIAGRACRAASRRATAGFMKPSTLGRLLKVTQEERDRLRLRFIGLGDGLTAQQRKAAKKRREFQKKAQEAKRREAGMKPQSESLAALARRLGVNPNTLRTRLRRAAKKDAKNAEA